MMETHDKRIVKHGKSVFKSINKLTESSNPVNYNRREEMASVGPIKVRKDVSQSFVAIAIKNDDGMFRQIGAGTVTMLDKKIVILSAAHVLGQKVDLYVVYNSKSFLIPPSTISRLCGDKASCILTPANQARLGLKCVSSDSLIIRSQVEMNYYNAATHSTLYSSGMNRKPGHADLVPHEFCADYSSEKGFSGSGIMQRGRLVGVHDGALHNDELNYYSSLFGLVETPKSRKAKIREGTQLDDEDNEREDETYTHHSDVTEALVYGREANKKIFDAIAEADPDFRESYNDLRHGGAEDQNLLSEYHKDLQSATDQGYYAGSKEFKKIHTEHGVKFKKKQKKKSTFLGEPFQISDKSLESAVEPVIQDESAVEPVIQDDEDKVEVEDVDEDEEESS